MQPAEKTKAGYLARARALRDQAVKEGDQAYGAVVVRDGVIVGEGRNYVVLHSDPTASTRGIFQIATCIPRQRHARCARERSTGRAFAAITTKVRPP